MKNLADPCASVLTCLLLVTSTLWLHATPPGTVIAWGDNQFGQTNVPVGLSGVTAISAGPYHIVALKSDGTVVAWGINDYGQTNVPAGLTGVVSVAAGERHTVALKSNGTLVGWGASTYGQISFPANLSGVVAVAAGVVHTLALMANGTVQAWGANIHGESAVPFSLTDVSAISAGDFNNAALKTNGTVTVWGYIPAGQNNVPAGLSGVTAISVSKYQNIVALKNDSTVIAWGDASFGANAVPPGLTQVTAIATGFGNCLALKSDGSIVSWGYNGSGQLNIPAGLVGVTAIAAGREFSVAIRDTRPTINPIPDVSTPINVSTGAISFSIGDADTGGNSLTLSGSSSNPALVPNENIEFGGSGGNRTVTINPVASQRGAATITLTVSDGILSATTSFLLSVVSPEIQLRQPSSTNLNDGGLKNFGTVAVNASSTLTFTIKNTGDADLTGLGILIDGADEGMFTVTAQPTAPVAGPLGSTTFTVQFAPTSAGPKTAALHLASNDADENPFDLALLGNVTSLEVWRQTHFGSIQNSGDGADLSDYDKDGLVNLVEFAFGFNPKVGGDGQLPVGQIIGGNYVVFFNAPANSGITYGAEWSATMAPGSWQPVADTGTGNQHVFSVPMGANKRILMRFRVSNP